jgi:nicotinamide mononucleotide transporter
MSEVLIIIKNNFVEFSAVIFSIIYVILAAKKNIFCWYAAIVSVLLYFYICIDAKLYAESGLQVFYLIMAFYGLYNWNKKNEKKIISINVKTHLTLIIVGFLLTFLLGYYLTIYTSAFSPLLDSFTTIFSIISTYMVAKKILENWIYWIIIDVVSIQLYISRELYLTSLLFLLYAIIALYGYYSWARRFNQNV